MKTILKDEQKQHLEKKQHRTQRDGKDNIPETVKNYPFPIVGIGASAGGLVAFEAFFSSMPMGIHPDCAFVLVQHLSPDHTSILSEIIGRYTVMHVLEAVDGVIIEPNCVYVIPPNHNKERIKNEIQE